MDQFNVTLAGDVEITIKPRRIKNDLLVYDVYIEDKIYGTIYPDHGVDHEPPLVWRSHDNFDPYLLALIGKMIEEHDA